jgi:hypothetical protein
MAINKACKSFEDFTASISFSNGFNGAPNLLRPIVHLKKWFIHITALPLICIRLVFLGCLPPLLN